MSKYHIVGNHILRLNYAAAGCHIQGPNSGKHGLSDDELADNKGYTPGSEIPGKHSVQYRATIDPPTYIPVCICLLGSHLMKSAFPIFECYFYIFVDF